MPSSRLLTFPAVLALTATGAGVAGCGAQDASTSASADATMAQVAVRKTVASGTASFRLQVTARSGDDLMKLTGSGVGATDGKQLAMDLKASAPGSASGKGSAQTTFAARILLDGTQVWVRNPQLAAQVPGGKPWVTVDLSKTKGFDPGSAGKGTMSVQDTLAYLRSAGDVKRVGRETLFGARTTHLKGTITAKDAARALQRGGSLPKGTLEQLKASDMSAIKLDAWVDGKDRVRRVRLRTQQKADKETVTIDARMDLVRFNVPIGLDKPAADQVTDLTDQLSALGKGGTGAALGAGAGLVLKPGA